MRSASRPHSSAWRADSSAERITASRMTSSASSGSGRRAFSSIMRASSAGSRLPQLTPMRTGFSYFSAHSIIVANCSSRFAPLPTLPGLMRYFASARAQSGYWARSLWPLKWKSPTSGTRQPTRSSRSRMRATCAAASGEFTVMRTSSEPVLAGRFVPPHLLWRRRCQLGSALRLGGLVDGLRLRLRRHARYCGRLRRGTLRRGDLGGVVLVVPLVGDTAAQRKHPERQAEVHEGGAPCIVGERHRLAVTRCKIVRIGRGEAPGDALEKRLDRKLQQARVASHHAAHEGSAGKQIEALLLQGLELARGELEFVRHFRDRHAARFARAFQLGTDRISHIHPAAATGTRARRGRACAAGWRCFSWRGVRRACAVSAAPATALPG